MDDFSRMLTGRADQVSEERVAEPLVVWIATPYHGRGLEIYADGDICWWIVQAMVAHVCAMGHGSWQDGPGCVWLGTIPQWCVHRLQPLMIQFHREMEPCHKLDDDAFRRQRWDDDSASIGVVSGRSTTMMSKCARYEGTRQLRVQPSAKTGSRSEEWQTGRSAS